MENSTLDALIREVSKENEIAFEELVVRICTKLTRKVERIGEVYFYLSDSDAVLNEVLFKTWSKSASFKGSSEKEAWAWLYRITTHTAIDKYRQLKRTSEKTRALEAESDISDTNETKKWREQYALPSPNIQKVVEDKEAFNLFLESLSKQELSVVKLIFDGLLKKEAAKKLGISPARVSQIMKKLTKKVEILFK